MAPIRISRPRFLAYFLLEGGLVFLVLYGLAVLTRSVAPNLIDHQLIAEVSVTTGLFLALLVVIQWSNPSDKSNLRRQVILFTLISILLSMLSFGFLWVVYGNLEETLRRIPALLFLEGAIAVPVTIAIWRWISIRFDVLNAIRERVLIVGTGEGAQQVCRQILSYHTRDYAVVGFADEGDERFGTVMTMGARIQTDFSSLTTFAPRRVDRIIVALEEKRGQLPGAPVDGTTAARRRDRRSDLLHGADQRQDRGGDHAPLLADLLRGVQVLVATIAAQADGGPALLLGPAAGRLAGDAANRRRGRDRQRFSDPLPAGPPRS